MQMKIPDELCSLKQWAKFYSSMNWPVIPLHNPIKQKHCSCNNLNCTSIGKHPRVKNGLKDATTNLDLIDYWWGKWPEANIGIATGESSNLLVLDIDPRHGGDESIQRWEVEDELSKNLMVHTGGDGKHYYFSYPEGGDFTNKVNLRPGIDVRARGGYIVAPPSLHIAGKQYMWADSQIKTQIAPSWLISELRQKKSLSIFTDFKNVNSIGIHNTVSTIPEGQRNSFLACVAGSFRKYGLDQNQIALELSKINNSLCDPSLPTKEVGQIAKSIGKYAPQIHPTSFSSVEQWNDPLPLPILNDKVPPMDESYLPPVVKNWITDICKRMQVPIEFIAAPAIVGICSIVGKKIGVYPKQNDDWLVIPNLWGGIVARPGTFKSPSIAEALKPLEKIAEKENQNFEKKNQQWEIDKNINEAMIVAIKEQMIKAYKRNEHDEAENLRSKLKDLMNEMEERVPRNRRLKTNDATIEKLANLLLENPNGLLVIRDELAGWLGGLEKPGREGDREFYLESWNGYGQYSIDRMGRGSIHLPSLCLSIFGGIQPNKLDKYLTKKLSTDDDGLLQRFQVLVFPDLSKDWVNYDCSPDVNAQNEVIKLFENLHNLEFHQGENKKEGIHFTIDAQKLFNDWRKRLEVHLRSQEIQNVHYESHLAKYRSLFPSLALIFYLIECNGQNVNLKSKISVTATQMALRWCEYLDLHAQKIYKVHSFEQDKVGMAFCMKIKNGQIKDGDKIRKIYRYCWKNLDTVEKVEEGIAYAQDLNWVRVKEVKESTKSSKHIEINPNLAVLFNQ